MMIITTIVVILLLWGAFRQRHLIVFPRSLCDSKFPQVSRTLLSTLTDLNNAVVWGGSLLGSKFPFMFHSLFRSLVNSRYLYLFSPSFNFTPWSTGTFSRFIGVFFPIFPNWWSFTGLKVSSDLEHSFKYSRWA